MMDLPTSPSRDLPTPEPRGPEQGHLTSEDVDALAWKEIGAMARLVARGRVIFFPVLFCLVLLLVLAEPDPWRLWLFVGAGLGMIAILVRDFLWLRHRTLQPTHIMYLVGVVVLFQAVLIAVTGGVESPMFVILVSMGIVPSMVLGRPRPWITFAMLPICVVWFFTLGAITGLLPRLTPDYWGTGVAFASNPVYSLTRSGVFTAAILLGGLISLALRQALDRSVRKVALARQELLQSMKERNRDLLSLSGELAHELKNPLASIQGLSALVAKKLPQGSKEAEQMSVLIGEVRRMGVTLDEFLNFSRPITGLALRRIHPAELLADVTLMHEGMAHRLRVSLRVDPGDSVPIRCDPRKVKQVLVNLLQNSLEATPRGGRITLSTRSGPKGAVRIIISDTGAGLAEEVRRDLFSPGATTKNDGTGLGLTIARAIAEQHGGTLTLENREEGGCKATLTLPLCPPGPGANTDAEGVAHSPGGAHEKEAGSARRTEDP